MGALFLQCTHVMSCRVMSCGSCFRNVMLQAALGTLRLNRCGWGQARSSYGARMSKQ